MDIVSLPVSNQKISIEYPAFPPVFFPFNPKGESRIKLSLMERVT